MDSMHALVATVVIIYAIDCGVAVRRDDWTVVGWGSRWTIRRGPRVPFGGTGGFSFGGLWLPLDPIAVCVASPGARLDERDVERRVQRVTSGTARLRRAVQALFLCMCGALLWLARPATVAPHWLVWLTLIVLLWAIVIVLFMRAARELGDATGRTAWTSLSLLLSPLGASCALDLLTRELFRDCHPLAVAAALCEPRAFHAAARVMLHDAECASGNVDEAAAIRAFLDRKGVLDTIVSPPEPENAAMGAYCPRCQQQYRHGSPRCADCPGVRLLPLEPLPRS